MEPTEPAPSRPDAAEERGTDTMRKVALLFAVTLMFCVVPDGVDAKNENTKFALHYAGTHDTKANTCDFAPPADCNDLVVDGGSGPARYDVYMIAIEIDAVTAIRYGITCAGDPPFFYGWTNCADLEIPSETWPGCDEDIAQTYSTPQIASHVVFGIFEVYVYGGTTSLSTKVDTRVGFAEICDDEHPAPGCITFTAADRFATIGFNGTAGVNPCEGIPVQQTTWAQVKSLYR